MQRQNPRQLPENKNPTGTRCIHIEIPDDDDWERAAFSELTRLAQWFLWERNEGKDGKPVADKWASALESWRHMCCDDNCPETREVDGHTEYSPDGVNWYDYPGAMENPNFNNPHPYPEGTVPIGQTAECLSAENIITVYKEFAQMTIDAIDALAGWVKLVAAIAAFMAVVMSGGFATAAAVAIAAAVLGLVDTWVDHALDTDVVQTLRCALRCNADSTGAFDPTSFDLVRADVTAGAPVLAPIINAWLGGYGPVGLNRLGAAHIVSTADCEDCTECRWTHTFDFTTGEHGWVEQFGGSAEYSAGVGFISTVVSGDAILDIKYDLSPSIELIAFSFVGNAGHAADGGSRLLTIHDGTGYVTLTTYDGTGPINPSWTGDKTGVDILIVGFDTFANVATNTITSVTISGKGDEPIWT